MSALAKRIIAPAAHIQKIYCHQASGTVRSVGNTIAIGQDVPSFAKSLPSDPRGTNWIQIVREGDENPEMNSSLRIKVCSCCVGMGRACVCVGGDVVIRECM